MGRSKTELAEERIEEEVRQIIQLLAVVVRSRQLNYFMVATPGI